MQRLSRSVVIVLTSGLLGLSTALTGTATAATPQPFKIGTAISAGSVAIEPGGDIVVAYDVKSGSTGQTLVCVLTPGATTCSKKVKLTPLAGDTDFGTPQVFAPSADDIVVLQQTCCDSDPDSDLLWTSTDGGGTFGASVRVGALGVATAALIGNDIIFSDSFTSGGAYVQVIPVDATGPAASTATATPKAASDIGDGTYAGGALVASDYLKTDYTTYVAFAPSGKDFGKTSSYHNVGRFPHEQFIGISGGAMLTLQTTGKQNLQLRMFDGTGFGPARVVPTNGGGPGSYAIDQDGNGLVHVFTDDSRSSPSYHLFQDRKSVV